MGSGLAPPGSRRNDERITALPRGPADANRGGKFIRAVSGMSVDEATVRRVARLARIAVADDEVPKLKGELDAILAFVEELGEVDVAGVEPMTSVTPMRLPTRVDRVTDGGDAARVLANAPATEQGFFVVPKVVE